jgi:hypothetical protein
MRLIASCVLVFCSVALMLSSLMLALNFELLEASCAFLGALCGLGTLELNTTRA